MTKELKMAMDKDLVRVNYNLTRKFGYFHDIQHLKVIFEIMTDYMNKDKFIQILYNSCSTY